MGDQGQVVDGFDWGTNDGDFPASKWAEACGTSCSTSYLRCVCVTDGSVDLDGQLSDHFAPTKGYATNPSYPLGAICVFGVFGGIAGALLTLVLVKVCPARNSIIQ